MASKPANRGKGPGRRTPAQLQAVVSAVRDRYRPERIILFGSHAWGTPDADSDVDLLVVKDTKEDFFARCAEVRRLIRAERRGMALDLIVYTPQELEQRAAAGDPLVAEILRRGIVLHAA